MEFEKKIKLGLKYKNRWINKNKNRNKNKNKYKNKNKNTKLIYD